MAGMPATTKQCLSFIVNKMNSCLDEFKLAPFYQVKYISKYGNKIFVFFSFLEYCDKTIQKFINTNLRYDHRQYYKST